MQTDVAWLSDLGLTIEEHELLSSLIVPEASGAEALTDGMTPDELWRAMETSIRVYSNVKRAQSLLKPVIGRLLIVLESHPDIYKSRGFRTYDDFLTHGAPALLGLPRSEAYRSKKLAHDWPALTPKDFADIGEGKLYDLGKFTNGSDPKSGRWLEIAKSSTRDQLRDAIVQSGEAVEADLLPAIISIQTTVSIKQTWAAFVKNPQVQATVGSEDQGAILQAMIGEAASSWGI